MSKRKAKSSKSNGTSADAESGSGSSSASSDWKNETKAMLGINSEHRLRSENLAFDIDVWYPSLAAFTFATRFLPLSRTEAEAILHYQNARFNQRRNAGFCREDVLVLHALEARLDAAIRSPSSPFAARGAFMRLCGRSPKDGEPLDRRQVRATYAEELRQLRESGAPDDANTRLRAVSRVNCTLRVRSGAEAMSLLLTSERVFTDLHDWLKWGEPEQVPSAAYSIPSSFTHFESLLFCAALLAEWKGGVARVRAGAVARTRVSSFCLGGPPQRDQQLRHLCALPEPRRHQTTSAGAT